MLRCPSHSPLETAFSLPNGTLVKALVHGGAWDIPPQLSQAHRQGVSAAFEAVKRSLEKGDTPLDAIAQGLQSLENDPVFDAGKGSFLNAEGNVELDAGVMEGEGLLAGAVAALGSFANPGHIALAVLRRTEHVLLVGEGADAFAREQGFVPVGVEDLVLPREREAHRKWLEAGRPSARSFFAKSDSGSQAGAFPEKRGTVGVVLGLKSFHSKSWQLFAGTSTGGTPGKRPGRVGDVPIPGAGFYADNLGAAVSATGWGEAFLRTLPAKRVSDLCEQGLSAQAACEKALAEVLHKTGGRGGLIALSVRGEIGCAFSTPDMAVASPSAPAVVGIANGVSDCGLCDEGELI
jgi:L-asparaginase / beta-aspartyl-peptidase